MVVATALCAAFVPATAQAAAGDAFGVRPAHGTRSYFVERLRPGRAGRDAVVVTSASRTTERLAVYPVDGLTSETSGAVYSNRGEPLGGAGRWIVPGATSVTLGPGQSRTVPFEVRVPHGVVPGDHLGGIAIERAGAPSRSGLTGVFRTVVGVLVDVPGRAAFAPRVTSAVVDPIPGTDDAAVRIGLVDASGLLGKPQLGVTLEGPSGYRRTVSHRLDTILPDEPIDYQLPWPDGLAAGRYEIVVRASGGGHTDTLRASTTLARPLVAAQPAPPALRPAGGGGSSWVRVAFSAVAGLAALLVLLLAHRLRLAPRPVLRRMSGRRRTLVLVSVAVALVTALLVGAQASTAGSLVSPSVAVSNSVAGATGVSYTFTFTTATSENLTSITMTVPSGTSGSPSLGTLTFPYGSQPTNGHLSLAGTTLTYSFTQFYVAAGATVSIQVNGLTNPSSPGSFTSSIATIGPSYENYPTVDSGTSSTFSISGGSLTNTGWSVSNGATSATGVAYTFTFTTATTATLTSVGMSVPSGTGGSPAVGSVSGVPSGGSVSLNGGTLTYSGFSQAVTAGTSVSIQITGLTNTSSAGSYTSQLATLASGTPIDTGTSSSVAFTSGALTNTSWSVSNSAAGAAGVKYTYAFTIATGAYLTQVTMTVPSGTTGTPTVGPISSTYSTLPANGTVSLTGTTLTYSFASTYLNAGYNISIEVDGLTNTSTSGSYQAQLTTRGTGGAVDSAVTAPVSISGGTLASSIWTVSNTASAATNVTYTYGFTTASSATLSSVTMTVPPGTGGTPAVGSVGGVPAGGTVSLASNTLTYSFTPTSVAASTAVTIHVTGLTNTSNVGSYTSELTTLRSGSPVDTGLTAAVSITGGSLTSPVWSTSSSTSGATGVSYTYSFTTGSSSSLSSVTMSVPPGTAGTPAVTAVSGVPSGGTVSLAANTLTYSFAAAYVNPGTAVSLKFGGLTNTTSTGTYTSQIATKTGSTPVDTGVTAAVSISGGALTGTGWSLSTAASGATGVTYTYRFQTASDATLDSVTMTVPPGTAGTPAAGSVTGVPSGGSASLASNTLTYAFAATEVGAGTAVTIHITGMTNTTSVGSYTSQLATVRSGSPIDTGQTAAQSITGGSLSSPVWSISSATSGATGVAYAYSFATGSGSYVSSLTMTVPPGTAGTPSVTSVTGAPSGGSVSLASDTLTYSFASTYLNAGTSVSLHVGGLTNTTSTGIYTAELTTMNGSTPVDTGVTAGVSISGGALTNMSWTLSNAASGATGVTYTYRFETASTSLLDTVTMTVPPGTAGTPAVGSVSGVASGGSVALASNSLTYSFTPTLVAADTIATIHVTGLTNTTSTGSYTSQIATSTLGLPIDTGTTAAIAISGGTLTNPIWTVGASGSGATNVTYDYSFTTASGASLTSITMTVPPGTSGTPQIASIASTFNALPTNGTISLANNVLTYTFAAYLNAGTAVSIDVSGLTNTLTPGSYTSQLATAGSGGPVDSGESAATAISGGTLGSPIWTVSNFSAGAADVTYTYTFTTASSSTLDSVTMTVPPGTAGTPGVGTVTGLPSNGTASLAANTLTYSFAPTLVGPSASIAIAVTGVTNTTSVGSYTSEITTNDGENPIDAGLTATASIGGGSLTKEIWSPSNFAAGHGASYTYGFTTGSGASLTSITMTVPPGTTGTPAVGTVTSTGGAVPTNGTVTLASNTLTYSFATTYVNPNYAVSIQITGLSNTSSAGSYTSQIATHASTTPIDSGVSPTVAIADGNPYLAYVVDNGDPGVLPLHLGSGVAGAGTTLGTSPQTIAMTPAGTTAYVVDSSANALIPVNVSTGAASSGISLSGCTSPKGVAITPSGSTAFVTCSGNARVVPVALPGGSVGSPISVGSTPVGIAVSPDGTTAYAVSSGAATLTPIAVSNDSAGSAISLSGCTSPQRVAIVPSGATAFVSCSGNASVVPVSLPGGSVGSAIAVGASPGAIAVSPDGSTVLVANSGSASVTPITVATKATGAAVSVGTTPDGIAISPDGSAAYVSNGGSGTVSQIRLSDDSVRLTIAVGTDPLGVAFVPDQAPAASLTVTPGAAGQATSFDASASSAAYGTIASYAWSFGDGVTTTTSTPTVTHLYAAGCTYPVTLTETDSAGTSTTQVFTGQSASRNGGSAAQVSTNVGVTQSFGFVNGPSSISFSSTLSGLDETLTSSLGLDVGDGTGTSGWSISATSTTFSTGGGAPHALPATAVTVRSAPATACDAQASCTTPSNAILYPFVLPAGSVAPVAAKLYDASSGTGVCDQTVTPTFSLAIPAGAYAGSYSSTWTFTLASGP